MSINIADRYATLKAEIDALTKELDAVKEEIKASGVEVITGEHAKVIVSLYETTSFDSKLAKTYLTAEQAASCNRKILATKLIVKPVLDTVFA